MAEERAGSPTGPDSAAPTGPNAAPTGTHDAAPAGTHDAARAGTHDAARAGTHDAVDPRVAELQAQVADYADRWRRALADMDNLRKRVARDAARTQLDERARVAAEWLPVLDNLDLALEHAESDPASIIEGVRAVREQARAVLSRLGFPHRTDVGVPFDPARHEAVAAVPDPQAPAGTVIRVVRPGYGDDERQLRPAAVVVAATRGE